MINPTTDQQTNLVHGTVVRLGNNGILLRGAPGSGKSTTALTLLRRARQSGIDSVIIADDYCLSDTDADGRLCLTCPAPIKGKIEIRPLGIVAHESGNEDSVVLSLIVDLDDDAAAAERVQSGNTVSFADGVHRHLAVPARSAESAATVIFVALGWPSWY